MSYFPAPAVSEVARRVEKIDRVVEEDCPVDPLAFVDPVRHQQIDAGQVFGNACAACA